MRYGTFHYITISIIIVCAVVLIGWDIYVVQDGIRGNTISAIIFEASLRLSALPYAFGVLMGHLFWPSRKQSLINNSARTGLYVCLCSCLIFFVIDIINSLWLNQDFVPFSAFLAGILMGHFFWLNEGKEGE